MNIPKDASCFFVTPTQLIRLKVLKATVVDEILQQTIPTPSPEIEIERDLAADFEPLEELNSDISENEDFDIHN